MIRWQEAAAVSGVAHVVPDGAREALCGRWHHEWLPARVDTGRCVECQRQTERTDRQQELPGMRDGSQATGRSGS